MKKQLIIYSLFLFITSIFSQAQNTTVSGTIVSPDGFAFAGGTVTAIFTAGGGQIDCTQYTVNGQVMGTPAHPCVVQGTMSPTGLFSIVLTDDHQIFPQGGLWAFTVCSLASVPCSTSLQDVFGATIDLSTQINSNIAPFQGSPMVLPMYYSDAEVQNNAGAPSIYFNLASNSIRIFSNGVWQQISGNNNILNTHNVWNAQQDFNFDINMLPVGGPNINFNRLISTSANHPINGGSILGGPSDSWANGCVSCIAIQSMFNLISNGVVVMNVFKPHGSSAPLSVGDYLGVQLGFGPAGSQAIGSFQTTNSDLVGKFTLTASTTSSAYNWTNSYSVAPEVVLTPHFDLAGTRCWPVYNGVISFTITCSGAVTGTIGYTVVYYN